MNPNISHFWIETEFLSGAEPIYKYVLKIQDELHMALLSLMYLSCAVMSVSVALE